MTNLYHKEVYWKTWFDAAAIRLINNKYSYHLRNHFAYTDAKHDITADKLDAIIDELLTHKRNGYIYEVEADGNHVVKAVIRTSYNDTYDVSIVFGVNHVRTAWINAKTDKHRTLNTAKYSRV